MCANNQVINTVIVHISSTAGTTTYVVTNTQSIDDKAVATVKTGDVNEGIKVALTKDDVSFSRLTVGFCEGIGSGDNYIIKAIFVKVSDVADCMA